MREVRVDPRLGRKLFDVDLRSDARILWAQVEEHYGRQVRELKIDDLGYTYYGGLASVDPDGTPVIEVTNTDPVTEEKIVHELYHLKLYTEGFLVIRIDYPKEWEIEKEQPRVRFIVAQVYDTIEHWIFYPRMREMGLVPDDVLRSNADRMVYISDVVDEDVPGLTRGDALAIEYFKAALLLSDERLLKLLTEHYRRRGWNDALRRGTMMAEMVKEARPSTPEEVVNTLLRCLSVIERGQHAYKLAGWETELRGDHKLRRIYLKVTSEPKKKSNRR